MGRFMVEQAFRDRAVPDPRREATHLLGLMVADAPTIGAARIVGLCTLGILVAYLCLALMPGHRLANALLWHLDITSDNSFASAYMHGLAFLSAALFLLCYLVSGTRLYLFLGLLYAFVWFDDAAGFHERIGGEITRAFDFAAAYGLRGQDFGELIVWMVVAGLFVPLSFWTWAGRRPGDPGIFVLVMLTFAALVVFGLVFDMLDIAAPPELQGVTGFVEDGGEMLAVSLSAILALGLVRVGPEYQSAHARDRAA